MDEAQVVAAKLRGYRAVKREFMCKHGYYSTTVPLEMWRDEIDFVETIPGYTLTKISFVP